MARNKTSDIKTVICSVLALILVFMGVVVICLSVGIKTNSRNISNMKLEKLTSGDVIKADELSVIAPYMYTETDGAKTVHVIVSFADSLDRMCIASLSVPESDDMYSFIEKYTEDNSVGLGNYALNGWFMLSEVKFLGEEMKNYYNNACEKYSEVFSNGSKLYYNGEISVTELDMKYICSADETPPQLSVGSNGSSLVIGIIIAVTGVFGIGIAVYNIAVSVTEKRKGGKK